MRVANLIHEGYEKYEVVLASMNVLYMPPPASGKRLDLNRRDGPTVDDDDIDIIRLTE